MEKMKTTTEGDSTLFDRTAIFYASNLGNSSSHDNNNLPILLAGGSFKHQGHLAFDTKTNKLLSNLYVLMLHHTCSSGKARFVVSPSSIRVHLSNVRCRFESEIYLRPSSANKIR